MSDIPIFYIYEDKGKWLRTDKALTAKLNSPTFNDTKILAGHSFYPQWPEPQFKSETRVAWRITTEGDKVVRFRKATRQHRREHGHCEMVGKSECAYTQPLMLRWDGGKKFWVLQEQNNINE